MAPQAVRRALLTLGPLAFLLFHLVAVLAAARNPWWSFWRHAFSGLGDPRAADPWIYNAGMVALGVMLSLFSIGLLASSKSKGAAFASGLFFVSGVFLALIGIYPSGTRPHTFVSAWFYVQFYMASIALGLALLREGKPLLGATLLLLGLAPLPLGYLIDVTVGWPSVAVAEYAGALFMAAAAAVAAAFHW